MSDLKSEYTIAINVDDNTRDAVRAIEADLAKVGKGMDLKDVTATIDKVNGKLGKLAKDTSVDFDAIAKAYSKQSQKAVNGLEKEYIALKDSLEECRPAYEELKREYDKLNAKLEEGKMLEDERCWTVSQTSMLFAKMQNTGYRALKDQIEQNRNARAALKLSEYQAKNSKALQKAEQQAAKVQAATNKLNELLAKRREKHMAIVGKFLEKRQMLESKEIKDAREQLKLLTQTEQAQGKLAQAIQKTVEKQSKLAKAFNVARTTGKAFNAVVQGTYNVTGLIGGAGRTAAGMAKAGMKAGQMIGGAVQSAAQAADRNVDLEQQANRVKGFSNGEARDLLHSLYIQTGADYSTIVDAVNNVRTAMGTSSKDELLSAAAIELKYPGMTAAIASTKTEATSSNMTIYAQRLSAMQKATGASMDQIQASVQKFANMKASSFGNAKVSELQAVYLGLQGSGAFESDEELENAFQRFVKANQNSSKSVMENASAFDWTKGITDDRNLMQVQNTLQRMDWSAISDSVVNASKQPQGPTESEQMAMQMRKLEDQKNQLLLKLIPAVMPLVEKISELMGSKGEKIVNGLVSLFETVIPLLEPVFDALNRFLDLMTKTILPAIQRAVQAIMSRFGGDDATQEDANGGIALGPTLVGERSFQPEMILPLDYSRSARAGNIVQSVSQTFNMSGNETTALSLAQAVSSRDFNRAMGRAAFKSGRIGAF